MRWLGTILSSGLIHIRCCSEYFWQDWIQINYSVCVCFNSVWRTISQIQNLIRLTCGWSFPHFDGVLFILKNLLGSTWGLRLNISNNVGSSGEVFPAGVSNLVSQIKPPTQSSHTKEETISTGCALEHQLHRLFLYNIVHPPLSRGLNTAHCFFLETVQANGFVSKSASSSSAANLQPLSELKSHSRTAENAAAAFCYLRFLCGGRRVSVCVCPRAVIRTASGCWTDDVFSFVSTHTHTFHSGSAARRLWMFVGATYQHSSQPSAAFQLPDPLTPSSAAFSHCVCLLQTKSLSTSHLVSYSALKTCFTASGVR